MKGWWLKLLRHAHPPMVGMMALIALMLGVAVLDAIKPWPLKLLIDDVLKRDPNGTPPAWLNALPGSGAGAQIAWLLGGMILLFLITSAARVALGYIQSGLGNRMAFRVGAGLFDRVQELSLLFHGKRSTGDLVRRIVTDSTCVRDLLFGVLVPIVTAVASLGIMFAIMWKLDWMLSLIAIAFALPLIGCVRLFTGAITERTYRQEELEGQLMTHAEQTLTALPVVQTFSREQEHDRQYRALTNQTLKAYLRATVSQLQFKMSTTTVTAVGSATVMVVGGLHVLDGRLTIGSLVVFLAYLTSLYAPLETLAYVSGGYAAAAAGARRVLEVLESEQRIVEKPAAQALAPSRASGGMKVEFDDVTFGYEPDRAVLHDVNLIAHPGETVAIVGPTGAGKSTLVSLIPRLFDPWQGVVRIDGQDLRDLKLDSLRQQVAIVPQEPFLLPLTVAENIAYGRSGATMEQIKAAAIAANADEFIVKLPQGYETVLGERGATLSVGQRQRLAIARALLKDAPVLILDEPTSALDAQTEHLLMEALQRLMEDRTCFVIAHRLSTIRRADRIVVVEAGRIVEAGTHEQLIERRGTFSRFHELQSLAPAAQVS